ncbi:2-hydroxychromene-2-carboxylate isomerase [Rubrivivax albus]|uniref:2-hydroxychromene-2-carboxylate isomerase n=1 Tax=Rubrivivax albus TaxID=2499835 RepID=A0A3S2UQS6_9BURK|nr:2-hydroxychromene-2-carboxylate isomerase [Rubrivivax albus]RVT52271.1 2-hydroxychromene-2-carboxylate isomerase [Rubrivivax albus]
MQRLIFHLDPISPYAYLAFEALPQALEGCSYWVEYRPVLFAGLLQHHGQKGPAEIAPKRAWTYRDVAWRAHQLGVPLQLPARHPFNPLPLLRLMLACAPAGQGPNRRVCEAVLHHVWRGDGADAEDPQRVAALTDTLAPVRDPAGVEVKAELRALTEAAVAEGVFGVPTVTADGRHFWGVDALPMLAAWLKGDPWFDGPAWDDAAAPRPGVQRA